MFSALLWLCASFSMAATPVAAPTYGGRDIGGSGKSFSIPKAYDADFGDNPRLGVVPPAALSPAKRQRALSYGRAEGQELLSEEERRPPPAAPEPEPAPAAPSTATTETEEAPANTKFAIREYRVRGSTLHSREELINALKPYIGPSKDFSDIQGAVEALEKLYRDKGFSIVQIELPEQEIESGSVAIKVLESKIGGIIFTDNRIYDEKNIRYSLPALREGFPPNVNDMGNNIRLANEHPARQIAVTLKARENQEGWVDAVVGVTESNPKKLSLAVDNSGTDTTGVWRTTVNYTNANVANQDHLVSFGSSFSPEGFDKSTSIYATWRVPLYAWNGFFDLTSYYSSANITGLQIESSDGRSGNMNIVGGGHGVMVKLTQYLARDGSGDQKLVYGADYKHSESKSQIEGGASDLREIDYRPFSLAYSRTYRSGKTNGSMMFNYVRNFAGNAQQFNINRPDSSIDYSLLRYTAAITHNISNWVLSGELNGQWTDQALITNEQFGLGGNNSVRGFDERVLSYDQGYNFIAELRTPPKAIDKFQNNWWLFSDYAAGNYVPVPSGKNPAGVPMQDFISSWGIGTRLDYRGKFQLKADYGTVLQPTGKVSAGDQKLHLSMSMIF